jgi:hypothetical protein
MSELPRRQLKHRVRFWSALVLALALGVPLATAQDQFDEDNGDATDIFDGVLTRARDCVATVLNRSSFFVPGNRFQIFNVAAEDSVLRVTATCRDGSGNLVRGQSEFVRAMPGSLTQVRGLKFSAVSELERTPQALRASPEEAVLQGVGVSVQSVVTAIFTEGDTADFSQHPATTYFSSNEAVATVDPAGLVTARASGTAAIGVMNQGALASIVVRVSVSDDTDGDGLPDDYESARGCLNPESNDASQDPDGDELSSLSEFGLGTDPCFVDTDGDGLSDGAEAGSASSPLLADTDFDGLLDGLEPPGDLDGDGTPNVADPDSDNDGLPDGLEVRICGTLFCADPLADHDGDGLRNIDEVGLFTDPLDADSDSDGLTDGEEALRGTDPLVPDGTSPTVALATPSPGTDLVEGERLSVRADATDDGRVTRVEFRVDGNVVATVTTEPFEATLIVPIDIGSLSIEAIAFDTNANSGTTGAVQFTVIPDPLTTVEGLARDEASAPIEGAQATVRLPDVRMETGSLDATGSALEPVPDSPLRSSSLTGEILFDAGVLPLLGDAADLEPGGPLSLSGTLALDFTGFNAQSPTPRRGTLTLSGTAPTGLSLSIQGEVEDFLPVAGEQAFTVDLVVTAFDPAGVATAIPLAGRSLKAHLQGGVQVTVDPMSSEVTSLAMTGGLEMSSDLDFSATSGPDGSFSIAGVPTIFGDMTVDAEKRDVGGLLLKGSSGVTPFVRGGVTDVGDVVLRLLPRARRDYLVGSNPLSMAVGDVNEDGIPDAVTANALSNSLTVFLGQAGGTLLNMGSPPVGGTRPRGVALADFNEDGHLDAVTGNENSLNLSVLLGDGRGGFSFLQNHGPGASARPFSVATGDFNEDGHADIAVVPVIDAVGVLLGVGDGTFAPAFRVLVADGGQPLSVAVGDLNGDGFDDLVTANASRNNVSVVLGNGDGTFQPSAQFAAGDGPQWVSIGHLNGDTAPDLAVVNRNGHNVSVLLGNGNGSFQAAQSFGTGSFPFALGIGDLTGDGINDLVVSSTGADNLTLLRGTGNGTFLNVGAPRTGQDPSVPVVVDVNGDSRQDVVLSDGGIDSVSVFIGRGDGTIETNRFLATQDQPTAVDVGDVNNDGNLDLVMCRGQAGQSNIEALLGAGDGSFPTRRLSVVRAGVDIELGDLNGDELLDLAVAEFTGPTGSVYAPLGNGDGTFTVFQESVLSMGDRTSSVRIADLNGDGALDIVATNRDSNTVSVRLAVGASFGFQPAVHYAVGSLPLSVDTTDLNGDGALELAVANFGSNSVSILMGSGDGAFAPAQSFPAGGAPFSLRAGDFDRDGKTDLAVTNDTARTVSILIGLGDGTLEPPQPYAANRNPRSVMSEDLNADGVLDLVLVNTFANNVAVLLGRGDGTFRAASFYGVQVEPSSLTVGDVNKDGAPDLIVTNPPTDEVSILFGRGDGTF